MRSWLHRGRGVVGRATWIDLPFRSDASGAPCYGLSQIRTDANKSSSALRFALTC
jgi:hypothetical protein